MGTPLLIAAHQGHTDISHFLCSKHADVNKAMEIGWTPLFVAAMSGHEEVGEYLVSANADVDVAMNLAEDEGNPTLIRNLNHWTDGRLQTTVNQVQTKLQVTSAFNSTRSPEGSPKHSHTSTKTNARGF